MHTDDKLFLVVILSGAFLFFCCLLGYALEQYGSRTIAIEAIKAGLVQDERGHWVKR